MVREEARRRSHTWWRGASPAWLAPPLLLGVLLGVPLVLVLANLTALAGPTMRHLASTVLPRYVGNTIGLVLAVSLLSAAIGVGCAWLTTAYSFPGRRLLAWLLVLPLALPGYIAAITYAGIFDFTGPAQLLMRNVFGLAPGSYPVVPIQGFAGLTLVLTSVLYPYTYITARSAFAQHSGTVLEIARSLGRSEAGTFFRAVLPLARPGIVAGVILVAMETLGEFGASHYYGVDTLTIGVFRTWFAIGDIRAALGLAGVLLVAVGLLIAAERSQRRQARYHAPGHVHRPRQRTHLVGLPAVFASLACVLPVVAGFAVPVAQLLWWAARTMDRVARWELLQLVATSFALAVVAMAIVVVLAVLVAYASRVRSDRLIGALAGLATSGYAIPGTVLAVGLATAFTWLDHRLIDTASGLFGAAPGLLLTGGIGALLAGYVARFFAVGYHAIDSGLASVSPRYDDVARTLGHRPGATLRTISLPLMRPAIVAAAVLLFVDLVKELPLTMILRPFNVETLATHVFRLASTEQVPESALVSLLIILTGVVPVLVLHRLTERASLTPVAGTRDERQNAA